MFSGTRREQLSRNPRVTEDLFVARPRKVPSAIPASSAVGRISLSAFEGARFHDEDHSPYLGSMFFWTS